MSAGSGLRAAGGPEPARGIGPDAPLFTISFPRSGTTLLRAMLHSHPEIAVLPEPWWMMRLVEAVQSEAGPFARARARELLARHVAPAWLRIAGLALDEVVDLLPPDEASGADVVSAVGNAYARRFGKGRWGVKYPGVEFRRGVRRLHALFPAGTVLFLARDPRDVYLSQHRAGLRRGLADLELFAVLWALQTRRILRDFRALGGRALVVRYEDLIEDPEQVLARICERAGLAAGPEEVRRMLDFQAGVEGQILGNPIHRKLDGPVLSGNRRRYVEELAPGRIRRVECAAGALLRDLGYVERVKRPTAPELSALALRAAWRLAVNVAGRVTGRSTLSGIRRDRIGRGRKLWTAAPPAASSGGGIPDARVADVQPHGVEEDDEGVRAGHS